MILNTRLTAVRSPENAAQEPGSEAGAGGASLVEKKTMFCEGPVREDGTKRMTRA